MRLSQCVNGVVHTLSRVTGAKYESNKTQSACHKCCIKILKHRLTPRTSMYFQRGSISSWHVSSTAYHFQLMIQGRTKAAVEHKFMMSRYLS